MSGEMLCIGGPRDGQRVTEMPKGYYVADIGPGLWKRSVLYWPDTPVMMSWVDVLIDGYRAK